MLRVLASSAAQGKRRNAKRKTYRVIGIFAQGAICTRDYSCCALLRTQARSQPYITTSHHLVTKVNPHLTPIKKWDTHLPLAIVVQKSERRESRDHQRAGAPCRASLFREAMRSCSYASGQAPDPALWRKSILGR